MLAYLGLRFDDLCAVRAFFAVVILEKFCNHHVGLHFDFGVDKGMVADGIDAVQVVELQQEVGCFFADLHIGKVIQHQAERRLHVVVGHTGIQLFGKLHLTVVAFVLFLNLLHVDDRAGKSGLAANHHGLAGFFAGKKHVAAGCRMAVHLFKLFPALCKKRAIVVEADEKYIRAPAQAIAHMKGRSFAAGKLCFAMRAKMLFACKLYTSVDIHQEIPPVTPQAV